MYFSLRSILLIVGSLCTGLTSAWLSLAGSRQRHTVLFCLGTMMNQLYHSAVSSTPSDANMCCSYSLSSSFLNGSCSAYATHLVGS